MSPIHFFVKPSELQAQTLQYGPIDNGKYRITSKFNLNVAESKIYSCFKGYVVLLDMIDPNSGLPHEDYVNLLLIPLVNDMTTLSPGVSGLLYRGLKRSDFMTRANSSSPWVLLDSSSSQTQLLQNLHANVTAPSLANLSYIEHNANDPNYALKPIYNVVNDNAPRMIAEPGMFIGNAASNGIGIEFILNDQNKFVPNVEYGMLHDYVIDVSILQGYSAIAEPGDEAASILAAREKIHGFIDPAVYFNLYGKLGVDYVDQGNSVVTATTDSDLLYNEIISKFATKNRVYFDIRVNTDYSLNFYGDNKNSNFNNELYDSNLLISVNDGQSVPTFYYSNNWPILILDNTTPVFGKDHVKFNLGFYAHYNLQPKLYLDFVVRHDVVKLTSNGNYFDLHPNEDYQFANDYHKFEPLTVDVDTLITNPTTFDIISPATTTQLTTAWLVKLYYLQTKAPANSDLPTGVAPIPVRYIPFSSVFDNVFGYVSLNGAGQIAYDATSNRTSSLWSLELGKKFIPRGKGNSYDRMVQTGVGVSGTDVTFFAIDLDRNSMSHNLNWRFDKTDQATRITSGQSRYNEFKQAIQNTQDLIFGKTVVANNISMFDLDQGYIPTVGNPPDQDFFYSLNFTRLEYLFIQGLLDAQNSVVQLNPSLHSVNFGFVDNVKEVDSATDYYYGKSRLVLKGLDTSGNSAEIGTLTYLDNPPGSITDPSQFSYPGVNLFVYSSDGKTYSTLNTVNGSSANFQVKQRVFTRATYAFAEYSTLVFNVETAFPNDTVAQIVSKIRNHYYGYYDQTNMMAKAFRSDPFCEAIPNSPTDGLITFEENLKGGDYKVGNDTLWKIIAKADENGIEDNPGPYITDDDGNVIDVGHLLYGLDGLIHNFDTIGVKFDRFLMRRSNDLTGTIADIFTAAAESRLYLNGEEDTLEAFYYPDSNDIDRLYDISAPNPDLLGDVDAFGLYNAYKYFVIDGNPTPNNQPATLSFLLNYYYDPAYLANDPQFPVDANYKKRWFNYCKKYDTPTTTNLSLIPDYFLTQYQGFIEEDINNPGSYVWAADGLLHQSRECFRRRGEVFAAFWYQTKVAPTGSKIVAMGGSTDSLVIGTLEKPVRFERHFDPVYSDDDPYYQTLGSQYFYTLALGNFSDPTELEYVLTKYLNWVKNKFNSEI